MAMMMEFMDATLLNTSLPQIAFALHSNPITLKVIITLYLLTLGMFVPVSSWMVERIGIRYTLGFAFVLFAVSSMACGLANNLTTLIIGRLVQGVGGAFMAPVARRLLIRVYGQENTIYAMVRASTYTVIGLAFGPIVGGTVTTYLSWRWNFFITVPFGIIGIILIATYLPKLSDPVKRRFDWLGFILIGGALALGMSFIDVVVDPLYSVADKIFILFGSLFLAMCYRSHHKYAKNILLDFTIFRNKAFRMNALASFLMRFTLSTVPFLIPLMLQTVYGYSAFQAGLMVFPWALGALVSRLMIRRWALKFKHPTIIFYTNLVILVFFLSYEINTFYFSPIILGFQQMVVGFFGSILFTTSNANAYRTLPGGEISAGTTILSAIIQLSSSFGIAYAAVVMIITIGDNHLSHHIPRYAFSVAFLALSIFLILSLAVFYRLCYVFSITKENLKMPLSTE